MAPPWTIATQMQMLKYAASVLKEEVTAPSPASTHLSPPGSRLFWTECDDQATDMGMAGGNAAPLSRQLHSHQAAQILLSGLWVRSRQRSVGSEVKIVDNRIYTAARATIQFTCSN